MYGCQYRIATYDFAATPRAASASSSAFPCASVVESWGEPPPIAAYPSRLLGARPFAISHATGPLSHCTNDGSVMISGSEKRLYRKGSTLSRVSGPPRLSSSTPTSAWSASAGGTGSGASGCGAITSATAHGWEERRLPR